MTQNLGNLFIDGESVIEDETGRHFVSNYGGASISTARYKFGSSSIYLSGSGGLYVDDHADFNFGSGDFTIDFWFNVGAGQSVAVEQYDNSLTVLGIRCNDGNVQRVDLIGNPQPGGLTSSNYAFSLNHWTHAAVVRHGNTFTLYVNGIFKSSSVYSGSMPELYSHFNIGDSGTRVGTGWLDNIRITKGQALWTSNFSLTESDLLYTLDTTNPNIEITIPSSSPTYYTKDATITIGGTASDNDALSSITWENTTTTNTGGATGLETWSANNVPLTAGVNNIIFTAEDTSNNTNTDEINITRDNTNPIVTINNPTDNDNYRTAYSTIDLSGTATDSIPLSSVTWDDFKGHSGTATGTNTWTISNIPLTIGENTIQVMAHDAAGNMGYDQVHIEYDNNSNKTSGIYKIPVSTEGNIRGKAKLGFIRPTIKQLFTSDTFNEIAYVDPMVDFFNDSSCIYALDWENNVTELANNNEPMSVVGTIAYANDKNGSDRCINMTNSIGLEYQTPINIEFPFSVSFWAYIPTLMNWGTVFDNNYRQINLRYSGVNIYTQSSDRKFYTGSAPYIPNQNEWNHIVVNFISNNEVTLYTNNHKIVISYMTGNTTKTSSNISIGARNISDDFFTGMLDKFRIFNKTLTDSEVLQLFTEF